MPIPGIKVAVPYTKWRDTEYAGGSKAQTYGGKIRSVRFPHGKYHGLYIEMKYGRNTATQEQVEFMCDMKEAGHFVAVCHDAQSAISLIEQYINLSSRGRIAVCELENKNVYWDDDGICHIKSV